MEANYIKQHNVREAIPLPDGLVHCIVTSIPYWGKRDYEMPGQIGLEETPEEFIETLVKVFRECRRVLRDDGTLWLNVDDTYWGGKGKSGASWDAKNNHKHINGSAQSITLHGETRPQDHKHKEIKAKDMVGIPWMLAFALRADGWFLRQDIIWSKTNPMPESIKDRCTRSHEYVFLLTKSRKYFYDADAIATPYRETTTTPYRRGKGAAPRNSIFDKANKRSVWTVPTIPFKEAHFAVFPEALIVDCVKAGCPRGGTVLDIFMGSGTTAVVAGKLERNYIGFELNPDYIAIAEKRIHMELGLFAQH